MKNWKTSHTSNMIRNLSKWPYNRSHRLAVPETYLKFKSRFGRYSARVSRYPKIRREYFWIYAIWRTRERNSSKFFILAPREMKNRASKGSSSSSFCRFSLTHVWQLYNRSDVCFMNLSQVCVHWKITFFFCCIEWHTCFLVYLGLMYFYFSGFLHFVPQILWVENKLFRQTPWVKGIFSRL